MLWRGCNFATAMLVASVAFGVQLTLVDFGGSQSVAVLLSIVVVGWPALTVIWGKAIFTLASALSGAFVARPICSAAVSRRQGGAVRQVHEGQTRWRVNDVEQPSHKVTSATSTKPDTETMRERFDQWWQGLPDVQAGY